MRKTLRDLQAEAALRKAAQGGNFDMSVLVSGIGKAADPRWLAKVCLSIPGGGSDDFEVADDSGKIKVFPTVDAAIRFAAQVSESGVGRYKVNVESNLLYATKVPANIYTDAENKVVKLTKVRLVQVEKGAALSALVNPGGAYHGWDNGNAAQQARYAETYKQINALDADVSAIDDEIMRLNAIIASKP